MNELGVVRRMKGVAHMKRIEGRSTHSRIDMRE